jgi:hypothetical protein
VTCKYGIWRNNDWQGLTEAPGTPSNANSLISTVTSQYLYPYTHVVSAVMLVSQVTEKLRCVFMAFLHMHVHTHKHKFEVMTFFRDVKQRVLNPLKAYLNGIVPALAATFKW